MRGLFCAAAGARSRPGAAGGDAKVMNSRGRELGNITTALRPHREDPPRPPPHGQVIPRPMRAKPGMPQVAKNPPSVRRMSVT